MNLANRMIRRPYYTAVPADGGLLVTRTSIFSTARNSMVLPITVEQLTRYESGMGLIQDIFPDLTTDQREFIQSGATPEEWDAVFGEG